MPLASIQKRDEEINRHLRRNTLGAILLLFTGFSLFIPAFSLRGTKFDYQLFCFKPPSQKKPCQGKQIKKGVSWVISLEVNNNQQFKEKVTLLNYIPAQNPNAGIYGVVSGLFLFSAYLLSKRATSRLETDLDVVIANKEVLIAEQYLEQQQHLNLKTHQSLLQEDYLKSQLEQSYGEQKYLEMSDSEREIAATKQSRIEQLEVANFELQLAEFQALKAKSELETAEHQNQAEKLNKTPAAKDSATSNSGKAKLDEIIKLLQDHESGWLYTLCTTRKVLVIEGEQGSFKSYTAALIAFLRFHLKGHKLGWIVDSDYHQNKEKAWKILQAFDFEAYGAHKDGEGIFAGIERFLEGIKIRSEDSSSIETIIFDELTTYGDYPECDSIAKSFMKFALSAPRKAAYGLIAVTHSLTNEGMGKGAGMAQSRKRGILHLLLLADNDYNPTFQGTLNGFKNQAGELEENRPITLPNWFRPDKIEHLLLERPN